MSINRNNYEEYFILYMDNELNREDRQMVESFVELHPDLKEELDNLLQYKLEPDTSIVFTEKEELMKENGNSLISISNYSEWLTLYIDNELAGDQKRKVEVFIETHPVVKKELAFLQKVKLQPENIVFPFKESLYKTEKKYRVIPLRFQRAVAAIFIVALGISAVLLISNNNRISTTATVKTNAAKENSATPVTDVDKPVNELASTNNIKPPAPAFPKQETKNTSIIHKKNFIPEYQPVIKEEQVIVNNKPNNNLPKPINNPNINNINTKNEGVAKNDIPAETITTQQSLTNPIVTTNTTPPSDIVNASYSEGNELNQNEGKKNKLRGFFRKVTRVFEKRTNIEASDDDRLLVGGLAIKLN